MGIDLSRSSEDPMLLKTHGKGANLMGKDSTNWGELSDAELANWAIAGKQEAFCTLFCRHKIAIYQCPMRVVRDKWAAEELWQEVYIKTWRNVGTIGGCSSPLHWLLESAKNRGIDHVRHLQVVKKRIIVFDPEIHDFEDSSSDPGEVVIEREIALEAWKMLTPRSRKTHRIKRKRSIGS